jgi:hypothetical protein
MTVEIMAMLAIEAMIDSGLADKDCKGSYLRQEVTEPTGKYCNFYQSKQDLKLGNPFLSISMNLDGKPMIVQHFYNFENYKSAKNDI